MGFPVTTTGPLAEIYATSAAQKYPLGQDIVTPDGRRYVYAKNGGVALSVARAVQQSVVVSGHETALAVAADAAVGATSVTLTNATTAITANMYKSGYMFLKDGQMLLIKSHPAESTGSGSCVFTLVDEDALRVALTTASRAGLRKNRYDGVLVAPTTPTGVVAGVTVAAVSADYYCWLQTKGPANVLTNGTLIRGLGIARSGTTPGAVDVYPLNSVGASGQEQMLGTVMTVGTTAEYSLVDLNIN